MPIVQATDVPLQPFPTGRTSPQAPADYQQIPTDVSEFGALQGQALEKLGAGGEKLATGIGQIAVYRQHQFDLAETDKLSQRLDDKIEMRKRGDRSAGIDPDTGRKRSPGFLDLVGSEAVNTGVPDLNQDIKEISDSAPNESVRNRFMHIARARRAEAMTAFDNHYEKQLDIHTNQVQQAGFDQGLRKATNNWNDDNTINQALDDMADRAVKASTDRDPAVLENLRLKAHAKGAEGAIMGALGAGDEDRARHLFETFKHLLPGDVQERLTNGIEQVGQRRQGQDDKRTGADLERALSGEGPMPPAPGARGGGRVSGGEGEAPGPSSPNAQLATQRAPFASELNSNPALKKQLAAIVDLENPDAGTAVVESLMNRMVKNGGTIASGIGGGGESFYGPVRRGSVEARLADLERDPARMAARMRQIDQALAGSNIVKGYTDQGSKNDPNYETGGVGINIAGERFNYHGGDTPENRSWRATHQTGVGQQIATGPSVTATDATVPAGALPSAGPAPSVAAAPAAQEPGAEPDWVDLGRRIRESGYSPGAKKAAFDALEERKRQFDFGKTPEKKQAYHHQVAAAVEQRTDEIVQSAVRSDDPAVHAKAQEDLATLHKWGVATGGLPADTAYKMERKANADLVTGRAAYLDVAGDPVAALAFVQQNKDKLPADALHTAVRALQERADKQQGERLERGLMIGGGPGYVPGPAGPLPGGAPDFPTPLTPSPLQQKLQTIANSDYPDTVKKAASDAALARHHLQTVGQDAAKSDLEMAISKGEAGHADVEELYRQGQLSPEARTTAHNQLNEQDKVRLKQADALQRVNNAGNGGAPLDPKSAKGDPTAGRMSDRDALNFHYGQLAATWPPDEVYSRSIAYAEKYGLIPDALKSNLRGNLHSGSPGAQIGAANTIAELRNRNPQLVGELGDENDLRYATMLRTYTEAGVPPAQAVELATNAMKVAKPERDARDAAFNEERGKTQIDQHASDVKWIEGQNNGWFQADPTVDPVMRKEFEEVSKAEYVRTGNLEASRRMALDKINNIWGRTRVGGDLRYLKQAPEKYYSVPGLSDRENAAWMDEQLENDMRSNTLQDPDNPIAIDRLHLVHAPDRTAPDGRPAYQVWLEHPVTKDWNLVARPDGQARVWAPNWDTSAEKQRQDLKQQGLLDFYRGYRTGAPLSGIPFATPGVP